ncbi:hypothetical protein M9H77_10687 [Catharanthus roseus]|uniref:Uncharacterized protein n=1 Tax=Catharanthus roseus TaxID=4058 RepID=A0ACC0BCF7_CATRO|nr:hypothetical protein M9H77_10687 [Catharanthus roseus]
MARTALCLAMVVVILGQIWLSQAADCGIEPLLVCAAAVMDGKPPTPECCAAVKSKYDCACEYLKNPDYSRFVPLAKKILLACKLQIPTC